MSNLGPGRGTGQENPPDGGAPRPAGWLRDAAGPPYPPPPWRLVGDLYASVWLVPRATVPLLAAEAIPATIAGRALVVTGWALYAPGGVLAYREALCGVVLRAPRVPAIAITHIWVDHPASIAGGRALWGIPKKAGRFSGTPETGAEVTDAQGQPIAALHIVPGRTLPWRQGFSLRTVQRSLDAGGGAPVIARLRATGRLGLARADWRFDAAGPLGFLHGLRPWLSARLERSVLRFGIG